MRSPLLHASVISHLKRMCLIAVPGTWYFLLLEDNRNTNSLVDLSRLPVRFRFSVTLLLVRRSRVQVLVLSAVALPLNFYSL